MSDLNEYLEYAIMLAKGAGDILMEYFRGNHLDIRTKLNNSDVVTAADKASEKYIISSIHDRFPDHGIMAEESGEENSERVWRWVIDPLDGTTNFSQGLPVFCVSIALEYEGNPVVGVIYAPYLGELFHAIKGGGAFLNGRRIRCSNKGALSQAVVSTGVPYDKKSNPDNNLDEIVRIVPEVRGMRRMGAAAIDLSYVAAGFFDAYWELNLKRWDVAAGILIALEAGADVCSIRDNRNYSILASCPALTNVMKRILITDLTVENG